MDRAPSWTVLRLGLLALVLLVAAVSFGSRLGGEGEAHVAAAERGAGWESAADPSKAKLPVGGDEASDASTNVEAGDAGSSSARVRDAGPELEVGAGPSPEVGALDTEDDAAPELTDFNRDVVVRVVAPDGEMVPQTGVEVRFESPAGDVLMGAFGVTDPEGRAVFVGWARHARLRVPEVTGLRMRARLADDSTSELVFPAAALPERALTLVRDPARVAIGPHRVEPVPPRRLPSASPSVVSEAWSLDAPPPGHLDLGASMALLFETQKVYGLFGAAAHVAGFQQSWAVLEALAGPATGSVRPPRQTVSTQTVSTQTVSTSMAARAHEEDHFGGRDVSAVDAGASAEPRTAEILEASVFPVGEAELGSAALGPGGLVVAVPGTGDGGEVGDGAGAAPDSMASDAASAPIKGEPSDGTSAAAGSERADASSPAAIEADAEAPALVVSEADPAQEADPSAEFAESANGVVSGAEGAPEAAAKPKSAAPNDFGPAPLPGPLPERAGPAPADWLAAAKQKPAERTAPVPPSRVVGRVNVDVSARELFVELDEVLPLDPTAAGRRLGPVVLAADGSFAFDDVQPGLCAVRIGLFGARRTLRWVEPLEVPVGATLDLAELGERGVLDTATLLDLRERLGRVEVELFDTFGRRLEQGAVLPVDRASGLVGRLRVQWPGVTPEVFFDQLASGGRLDLALEAPGHAPRAVSLALDELAPGVPARFALVPQPTSALELRLVGLDQLPGADPRAMTARIERADGQERPWDVEHHRSVFDADGRVVFRPTGIGPFVAYVQDAVTGEEVARPVPLIVGPDDGERDIVFVPLTPR